MDSDVSWSFLMTVDANLSNFLQSLFQICEDACLLFSWTVNFTLCFLASALYSLAPYDKHSNLLDAVTFNPKRENLYY